MEFMPIKEAAVKWNLSVRRLQTICNEGMIEGAMKFGNTWAIPKDAVKPVDKRIKKILSLNEKVTARTY
jgi:galactose-1-phosphate uridylyltransferase